MFHNAQVNFMYCNKLYPSYRELCVVAFTLLHLAFYRFRHSFWSKLTINTGPDPDYSYPSHMRTLSIISISHWDIRVLDVFILLL